MPTRVNTLAAGDLAHLVRSFERGIDPPDELLEPLPLVVVEDDHEALCASNGFPAQFPLIVMVVGDGAGFHAEHGLYDIAVTGVGPSPAAPWVSVERFDAAIDQVASTVAKAPVAAATFVQLLRCAAGLSIQQGLAFESLAYSTLQAGAEHAEWLGRRPPPALNPASAERGGEPPVVATRSDGTLIVELNRPGLHNAYNAAMRDALCEVLSVAAFDKSVKLQLRGRGESFCSGGDLTEFGSCRDPATANLIRTRRSPARLLAAASSRTRAIVHGHCAGSGLELASFASSVVADGDVTLWLPEISMGLIPGAGGTVSIPRRAGRGRTAWLGLSGERIPTSTAIAWGLVDGWLADHEAAIGRP